MFGRLAVAVVLLCSASAVYAQSRSDEYGYPEVDAEELAPDIDTDTALFYNSLRQADDLYDKVAGHRLSFVENRRRNVGYGRQRLLCEGVRLPVGSARLLRALGAAESRTDAAAAVCAGARAGVGTATCSFAERAEITEWAAASETTGSVGASFATRGYSAGIRASVAAAIGRGWELQATVEARTGRDLHVDGVFLNSAGAALRVAKRFGGGSSLSLIAAAEPSMRGLRSASAAEAFDLTGNTLYNPSWGWHNGQQRNSRVRREAVPFAVVAYSLPLGESTLLTAVVAAQAGIIRRSSLGWYDAATPMPDNYRYLPGYFTGASARAVEDAWRAGDARYTQINWAELYTVNRMSDRGAVYALEDRVQQTTRLTVSVGGKTTLGRGTTISYGVDAEYSSERCYKQMRDLLGASFTVDIDYFLIDDDSFANSRQNDLQNPDRIVRHGDRFGYDYALIRRSAAVYAAAEYSAGRFDMHMAGRIGVQTAHRHGYFEKELFAGSGSLGDSEKVRLATYAAAAELGWSISPRHRISALLHASAEAPDTEDLFLNPQYNNRSVGPAAALRRFGAEIKARTAFDAMTVQASLFAESQRGGIRSMQYYDDLAGEFCDMSVSGIDILTYGIEAAATFTISQRWYADAAVAAMQCKYSSDPTVRVWTDSANSVVDAGSASHMGGCVPGGVPRLTAVLKAGYRSRNGWSIALAAAWAAARRAEPSFVRRTERVAYQAASSPEAFGAIVAQETLPDALNVDLNLSKRWLTGRSSRITAALTICNLLGERGNIHSAYESQRVRHVARGIQSDFVPLPTRYLYTYPRSVVLTASYSF